MLMIVTPARLEHGAGVWDGAWLRSCLLSPLCVPCVLAHGGFTGPPSQEMGSVGLHQSLGTPEARSLCPGDATGSRLGS